MDQNEPKDLIELYEKLQCNKQVQSMLIRLEILSIYLFEFSLLIIAKSFWWSRSTHIYLFWEKRPEQVYFSLFLYFYFFIIVQNTVELGCNLI